jgi:hypothetical protein
LFENGNMVPLLLEQQRNQTARNPTAYNSDSALFH